MKTIRNINLKDKIVLVRVDYNVPVKNGKVTNDLRIRASLPTIKYLLEQGVKRIILISHLGRPEGKLTPETTLQTVVDRMKKLFPDQAIGFYPLPSSDKPIPIPENVKIALLENLRTNPGEEANSLDFISQIVKATEAEIYVQDGFAVLHRAHASTDAIAKVLPVYAGFLVENEVNNLTAAIKNPTKPVLLIIGGAKVEDKQPLIKKFLPIADHIVIGGKIAADGYQSDNSKIYVAEDFDEDSNGNKLDVGPVSTTKIADYITDAKTIIWNGLLGYAEDPAYATASTITAEMLGEKTNATTIICGGDTTGFVENLMENHKNLSFSLVSTGGGAALEFLLGKELPGLKNIKS